MFQQVQQCSPPKWLAFDDSLAVTLDTQASSPSIEILLPTNIATGGMLSMIPMLSLFDESMSSDGDENLDMDLADISAFIYKFCSHFTSLKSKWSRAFTEVKSGYSLLVQDLKRLHSMAQTQTLQIGQPVKLAGKVPESLWQGLLLVQESVSSMSVAVQAQAMSIDTMAGDQNHITHSMLALELRAEDISSSITAQINSLTGDLRALEGRVLRLVPLLTQL